MTIPYLRVPPMRFRTALPFACLLAVPTFAHAQHASRDSSLAVHVSQQADSIALNSKLTLRSKRALARLKADSASLVMNAATAYRTDTLRLTRVDTVRVVDTVLVATAPAPTPVPTPTPTPAPVPAPTPVPAPVSVPSAGFSHPFAPPANGAVLAEFPRVQVDTTAPPVTRVIRTANLKAALDTARDGDEIRLPLGARIGAVEHIASTHAGWITVRSDVSDVAIAGRRMTRALADSLNLATIVTTSTTPGLWLHDGAHHIRFLGLKFEAGATNINALAWIGNNETTLAQLPHHIGFDRVLFDGLAYDIKRCLRPDAATVYVINSSLLGCKGNQGDSQGIVIINGAGPYLIANNRIEGGHQAIMLGGGDPAVSGMLPRDIIISGNTMCRPIAWKGVWGTKTILEFKIGQRILVDGNALCNVWPSGQLAFAVLLKSVNQGGSAPWSETSDVTVRYNRLACAAGGFNFAGKPEPNPVVPASRITVYGNVADSIGVAPCLSDGSADAYEVQGVNDLVIRDNWMRNLTTRSAIYFTVPQQRFVFVNNVVGGGGYGIKGDATGTNTLSVYAPGSIVTGNTIVPTGGVFPAIPPDSVRDAILSRVTP